MGNKIITEKDFWMCSTGCVPAPFQGPGEHRPRTKSGDIYITEKDKSTASFIDFGCSKYMWIAALAVAALAVTIVVVCALTVATGGAALLIIGAIAGAVGAMIGGAVGALLCGQQLSGKRTWIGTKGDFKVIGTPTITGNSTMTCAAGGSIQFMPDIKNWWQAVSLASANYIGEIFQGMMIGVTVGAAGMAYLGGAAAYSIGGMRAVGQAGLKFLASTPKNLLVNAVESVSKVGLIFRGVGGAQGALQSYGETGSVTYNSVEDGVFGGEKSAYRVVTGQGSWNDVWGTAMMFLPVGQGKRDVENNFRSAADDAADAPVRDAETTRADDSADGPVSEPETAKVDEPETTKVDEEEGTTRTEEPETTKADEDGATKSDEPETTKADEEEGNTTRNTESESPTKPDKDGQAYEDGSGARKATSEEVLKIDNIRIENQIGKGKNIAYIEGAIEGKPVSIDSHSGRNSKPGTVESKPFDQQKLKTSPTEGDIRKGQTDPERRAYDSEVKALENVLDNTTPDSTGRIKIVSERDLCNSCSNAVNQFKELRPNINVETVYSKPYKN